MIIPGQIFDECEVAGPASEEAIQRAEEELGVRFPPSYRKFLHEYGAAECPGFFIAGLAGSARDETPFWVDVVDSTNQLRAGGDFPSRYISISDDGAELKFFIDTSEVLEDQECPVVVLGPAVGEKRMANSFAEFVLLWSKDRLPL